MREIPSKARLAVLLVSLWRLKIVKAQRPGSGICEQQFRMHGQCPKAIPSTDSRDDQNLVLAGKTLNLLSPQGRFATGAQLLDGKQLHSIEAYGKHLFYQFDQPGIGPVLHVHLGLFGKFRLRKRAPGEFPEVRGATRVRFISPDHVVDLNGPNQCEVIEPFEMQSIIDRLGPDPLRDDADPKRAWNRIRKSRKTLGQLIMDQSVIAGIGNIYRTELLFRAGLSPDNPGNRLSRFAFNRFWKDAVELLNLGVKHNRIITVDLRKTSKPASRLAYNERTLIFGKSKCPRCGSNIVRFEISKRRCFPLRYMPACMQPCIGSYIRKIHQMKRTDFKICLVCERPMAWRRKWARTWDEVKYCSDACRRKSRQIPDGK